VPGHGTPAARGSKEEHDATCNRRPARYDPKELLFNMTERSKPDMQWSERYGYDQHPEEYSGKNKGYSNIFLTNTCQISWGHRELLADAEYERQNTPSCRRFPSVVEAKKRQTPDSPPKIRFAPDSPLEQVGFEPLVPLWKRKAFPGPRQIDLWILVLAENHATHALEGPRACVPLAPPCRGLPATGGSCATIR
jgi:hypothetical protein